MLSHLKGQIFAGKKLHLSIIIFFVCLLFSFLAWDHYFDSEDPIDRTFVSNLVLTMGILFSISAGLLVWSLESGKTYLENEIIRRTEELVAKEKEAVAAEIKRVETERRHQDLEVAFKQLKETQDQLIQSEKLASIGRVVAGIVHELNTPLVTMAGYMKLLMRTGFDPEIKNQLEIIDRQAERCRKIVRDLLTYARWDKPNFKQVDLCQLIEITLAALPVEFHREKIKLIQEYPESRPRIAADADQLQHVFTNLLMNAWQAFDEHTELKQIKISVILHQQGVQIFFTDTGPGIAKENFNKIFEPFFTTKSVQKGTGLGLSLVYAILQMHEGKINIQSEVGKGATFVVELPYKQASLEGQTEKPFERKKRILIADDEPAILQFMTYLLETWGYESLTATNGKEALAIMESENGNIEMVILDINMPGLNGFQTARSLRTNNRSSDIPIVFLTAKADENEADLEERKLLNIQTVLRKPFDYQELHQCLAANCC